MNTRYFLPTFIVLLVVLVGSLPIKSAAQHTSAPPEEPTTAASIYTVGEYDPARDPAEDLKATIQKAQAQNKRILLEVGGEWCVWCHILDNYIHEHEAVQEALRENFLIMKVNFSPDNENEAFLSNYPSIPGYPHIFVLESDGTFLHSQGTLALEEGRSYSREAFLTFLEKWAPED